MPPLTPLVRPDRFFAERDLNGLRVMAVVILVTIGVLAVFYGIGWIVADKMDGTVRVDNPERPPDWVCEDDSDVFNQSGCEKPRTVERNVDSQLWAAWNELGGQLLVAIPFAWVVLGVLLHAGSWLAGGKHGVFPSFAVAAWGLVPMLASGLVALVVLFATFDPIIVTPANQDTALETATESVQVLNSLQPILTIATAVWSAVIWRYGLEYKRGVSGLAAWWVAGLVAAFLVVVALL